MRSPTGALCLLHAWKPNRPMRPDIGMSGVMSVPTGCPDVLERVKSDPELAGDSAFVERITKLRDNFGTDGVCPATEREYRDVATYEQEITRLRWSVYVTLSSISFAIAGYTLSNLNDLHRGVRIASLCFAWFVHFFGSFFYWWMHGVTHRQRKYLIKLERLLGFYHYALRDRRPMAPLRIGKYRVQVKFHWVANATSVLYLAGIVALAVCLGILRKG